jgi:hypothetical protein
MPHIRIYDTLGRPVINPYPELNYYWADPLELWSSVKKDYTDLPKDPEVFYSMFTTELLLRRSQSYSQDIPRSPEEQDEGWVFGSSRYYIPAPDRPLMIILQCRDDLDTTFYFKARATDNNLVRYLDEPSISTESVEFYAYEVENIERKWGERILNSRCGMVSTTS